ncbi:MAG: hypothetical protein JWQ18_908 [Conexibacter sp.]|nr:hypothetical protein [Conexibacter sp.]
MRKGTTVVCGLVAMLLGIGAASASAGGWLPGAVDLRPGVTNEILYQPAIAVGREGTVVAAWPELVEDGIAMRVALRAPDGSFSAPQTLSHLTFGWSYDTPAVAVDAQGNATVAWDVEGVVYAAYHPAGGTWGPVQTLSTGTASAVSLAAGADGGAIAVWQGAHAIEGAIRPHGAARFGDATAISDVGIAFAGTPQAAMDPAGDVAVLWQRSYDPGDGSSRVDAEASAKAAGQAFPTGSPGRVTLTPDGGAGVSLISDVGITSAGAVVAMYSAADDSSTPRVYVRDRPLTGSFADSTWTSSSTAVSGAGAATSPQLTIDDGGGVEAVWSLYDFVNTILHGAVRPALGAFGDVPLSDPPGVLEAGISGSPAGDATAVWVTANGSVMTIAASHRAPGGGFGPPVALETAVPEGSPAVQYSTVATAADDQGNAYVLSSRHARDAPPALSLFTYDNVPPVLSDVTDPGIVAAGHPLTLSASATDRFSVPTFHWDFGDGASADGAGVGHTFTRAGTFTVTVTATDSAGNAASATRTAVVVPPTGVPTGVFKPVKVPAKVAATWRHLSRGRTAVKALSVTGLKAGDAIKVSCTGGGCKPVLKKAKTLKPRTVKKGTVSLRTALKALKLSPKAKLTIRISRKGYTSIVITYTMVKGKDPKRTLR